MHSASFPLNEIEKTSEKLLISVVTLIFTSLSFVTSVGYSTEKSDEVLISSVMLYERYL